MAEVKGITVKYGKSVILSDFSADFKDGAVTLISGRSGCGKTTLISVILGLVRPLSGCVSGFGACSALFQEDRLLPFLTAVRNITEATGCNEQAAREALHRVGFADEDLDKRASTLSGGMARRTAIVRAMLAQGDTVIFDEPFKGLDDITRATVLEFVKDTLNGRTMIVVTHDPRDIEELAPDKIINM